MVNEMTDPEDAIVPRPRQRRFWYVGDLIVIGLLCVYLTYVHWRPFISYRGGLHNRGATVFGADMRMGLLLPFAGILLLALIIRLSVSWPKHIRDRKRCWKLRGLVIAVLGLCIGSFFVPLWSSGDAFTRGLKECYARRNVDIPAIQAWLRTVDPRDCLGDQLPIRIEALPEPEQAKWPEAIRTLRPSCLVKLYRDAARRPVVCLDWGGFGEGYGIIVGSVDWEVPQRGKETTGSGEFYPPAPRCTRPLAPGAYVWYSL